jgi:hypothetical protein
MIRYPWSTALEDVALFFFDGETVPFTHEDPLANCTSREEFQDTVRLMGALSREDPLLFSERFAPLPGVPLACFVQKNVPCVSLYHEVVNALHRKQLWLHRIRFIVNVVVLCAESCGHCDSSLADHNTFMQ